MISKIEFTANDDNGLLGKIAIALIKKKYKIIHQSVSKLDQQNLALFIFEIESGQIIELNDIDHLKTDIPEIIKINQLDQLKDIDKLVSSQLALYGKKLVGEFPDILSILQQIDNELDETIKEQVLTKLGKGLGRWLCKSNYSLGGLLSLDKTLNRMLWPSLNEFLSVKAKGAVVEVSNCPHCIDQFDSKPSCFFIKGYIEGFLSVLDHLPPTLIIQLHSKAMGDNHCDFEVKASG